MICLAAAACSIPQTEVAPDVHYEKEKADLMPAYSVESKTMSRMILFELVVEGTVSARCCVRTNVLTNHCLAGGADLTCGEPCIPNSNIGCNTRRGEAFYQVDTRLAPRFGFVEGK